MMNSEALIEQMKNSKIEMIDVDQLIPYARNARTHSDQQVDQIVASIKEFGYTNPILLDGGAEIIAGHGRLMALGKMGVKKAPCIRLPHLTEAQKKAYRLADNQLALNSGWDIDLLKIELNDLNGLNFDIRMIGFDDDFLNGLLTTEPESEKKELNGDPDEVPESAPARVSLGEIWQLGDHRLMCGDSTSKENLAKLLNGEKCDMVFCDPPYRMAVEGGSNQLVGRAAAKLGDRIKHLCEFDPNPFLSQLPTVFEKGKMNSYIFCNKDLVPDYLNWGRDEGYSFNILVWKKPNAIPLGGNHRPDLEYLLVFRKSAIWNNAIEGVNYSKCLEYSRDNSTSHPTMKPVDLICNEIFISSNPGSLVVDFFLGSGSTLVAAEKAKRRCAGMELDPKYCDIILARWEKLTGKTAEKIS